jgi:predicted RNase H-like HicB family nuclease
MPESNPIAFGHRHHEPEQEIKPPNRKFLVTLEPDETGMLVAECPAIPGCVSQGSTEAEALANIREAIEGCLEARAANGMPLTIEVHEVEIPA